MNQQFKKETASSGAVRLIKRSDSDKWCLNGGSGGVVNRNVTLWNSGVNSNNLRWFINSVGSARIADNGSEEESLQIASDYSVAPNPFSDQLSLELYDFDDNSDVNVRLIEATTGQLIYKETYRSSSINLNNLLIRDGAYIIQVDYNNGQHHFVEGVVKY